MQPAFGSVAIAQAEAVEAHTISFTHWGNPELPVVICVHGLTRNSRDFDALAEKLSAKYHVICPDMPGRGNSTRLSNPACYSYGVYVADIMFLLQQLKITQLHWVGTSMGGIIGMMLANTLPGVMRSLVLNDIGIIVSADGLKRIANYAGGAATFETMEHAKAALRINMASFGISSEAQWEHIFAHSLVQTANGVSFAYDPAIMAAFPKGDEIKDIDLSGLWEKIKPIPTLLIRGAQSDLLSKETALQMQASHPRFTLYEVANAGHAPALLDNTQTDMIAGWLSAIN